jgi:hypothetical protein
MDEIWSQLPYDLVRKILEHMDAATRRDLGLKPKKVITPYGLSEIIKEMSRQINWNLNLHHTPQYYSDFDWFCTFTLGTDYWGEPLYHSSVFGFRGQIYSFGSFSAPRKWFDHSTREDCDSKVPYPI